MGRRNDVIVFIFLFVALAAAALPAADGQEEGKKWSFGFNLGWSLTKHWSTAESGGAYTRTTDFLSGPSLGLTAGLDLGRLFALQGEVLYTAKGAKHTIGVPGFPLGNIVVYYNMDYVEIPIQLQLKLVRRPVLCVYLSGGIFGAFLVNGDYRVQIQGLPEIQADLEDLRSFDYGFLSGIGVRLRPGRQTYRFEVRMAMSLVDNSYPTGPGFPKVDLRNMAWSALFGIAF